MTYTVLCGDVSEVLPTLAPESFDAVLCDPPYGLSFMQKIWDHGVPSREVWEAVARTLKPGANVLAFGGDRTHHRLMVAIEDAGLEIRTCIYWLTGQGFPKSKSLREVGPEWHGYGTALKPAAEICILAMKPTDGTFAENALRHGVAGLNIDGGRIGTEKSIPNGTRSGSLGREGTSGYQGGWGARDATQSGCNPTIGRWPANLLLDEEAARLLDEMSGFLHAPGFVNPSHIPSGRYKSQSIGRGIGDGRKPFDYKDGGGGASRFFYCAKSSRREREAGLSDAGIERNHHPTLKPLALCEYLARLILPPKRDTPRRLLVPFSGSGSEMIGALLAGWDEVVGIEREAEYVAIAEARLKHWTDGAQLELSA